MLKIEVNIKIRNDKHFFFVKIMMAGLFLIIIIIIIMVCNGTRACKYLFAPNNGVYILLLAILLILARLGQVSIFTILIGTLDVCLFL